MKVKRLTRGQLLESFLYCQQIANEGDDLDTVREEISSVVEDALREERADMSDLEKLARMAMNGDDDAALDFMKTLTKRSKLP